MEIKEIVNEYLQLNINNNNNEIDAENYAIRLKELAFIDKSGTWWCPTADTIGWEYLDNSEWKTGDPIAAEVEPAEENYNFNYEPDPENIMTREEVPEEYFKEKDYDAEFENIFHNTSPIMPVKDIINCFSCHKEIPENSNFCPFCGSKADKKPEPGFCQKCNNQNPIDAKFCGFCGDKMN